MTKQLSIVVLTLGLCAGLALAQVTPTGDVTPADSTTWPNISTFRVGDTSVGAVDVTNGGALVSGWGTIAYGWDAIGTVTVDGEGSTWTSGRIVVGGFGHGTLDILNGGDVTVTGSDGALVTAPAIVGSRTASTGVMTVSGTGSTWTSNGLTIGMLGDGTVNITDGGLVQVAGRTVMAEAEGATGQINFDNGTLDTWSFIGSTADLAGTGTINTHGLVSDLDLIFDATHGPTQTLTLNDPGQAITVNLNADGTGALGAGHSGNGSLRIADGVTVDSTQGTLGYQAGSTGAATITGAGTTWNAGWMSVAEYGQATLDITDGAVVNTSASEIADRDGASAVVTVSGNGSELNSTYGLTVGNWGEGTLNVLDGATVTNHDGQINGLLSFNGSVVNVSGAGSSWLNSGWLAVSLSTLNISNGATVSATEPTYVASVFDVDTGLPTGKIHLDNGTLTTAGLLVGGDALTGAGTVNTGGLVSDIDLIFDSTHGLAQTVTHGNITINLAVAVAGPAPMGAGYYGNASFTIADGVTVEATDSVLGLEFGGMGTGMVTGPGSTWANTGNLVVGYRGDGTLDITNGGAVTCATGVIGDSTRYVQAPFPSMGEYVPSIGVVLVSGADSSWHAGEDFFVGADGNGTLNIFDGGLVSVGYDLTIGDGSNSESFINMASGGMLALNGQADGSLLDFMSIIDGYGSIRYLDHTLNWADLTGATYGSDYTLSYLIDGDLAGYTMLTVTAVPGPATLSLLALGGLAMVKKRRGQTFVSG